MNKLFAIAFTCIYLLLSVGVVKTTHYCMGRAKSTELFSFEAKKCACSLFSPENSCCKDTHEIFIIDDFQVAAHSPASDVPQFYVLAEVNLVLNAEQKTAKASVYNCFSDYSPPPVPLYLVNCSFVFYDDPYAERLIA